MNNNASMFEVSQEPAFMQDDASSFRYHSNNMVLPMMHGNMSSAFDSTGSDMLSSFNALPSSPTGLVSGNGEVDHNMTMSPLTQGQVGSSSTPFDDLAVSVPMSASKLFQPRPQTSVQMPGMQGTPIATVARLGDDMRHNVVMAESVADSDGEEVDLGFSQARVRPVHMNSFINFLHHAPMFF